MDMEAEMPMEFRVVPFVAAVQHDQGPKEAAKTLEELIRIWGESGWEYVRVESVDTRIGEKEGFLGCGDKPATYGKLNVVVFRREVSPAAGN
jgi:aspartate-semialdehyde dehydrogenase